jgi:hypothetical protein
MSPGSERQQREWDREQDQDRERERDGSIRSIRAGGAGGSSTQPQGPQMVVSHSQDYEVRSFFLPSFLPSVRPSSPLLVAAAVVVAVAVVLYG